MPYHRRNVKQYSRRTSLPVYHPFFQLDPQSHDNDGTKLSSEKTTSAKNGIAPGFSSPDRIVHAPGYDPD